ncbi:hypothetical protein [Hymenobacter guriensis]|uniref:Transmembrane protein n=1 Tax=Hymenobacter guriensis TaxID=2793065 RepID=A0ABS0KWW5_9BACT|nr:hypothetical protein [Hymenobacter guriensis]MBG8552368.1 hypothetical protein [Hymenobacter guriensis]
MTESTKRGLWFIFIVFFLGGLLAMAVSCHPARQLTQESPEPQHQVLHTPDVGRRPASYPPFAPELSSFSPELSSFPVPALPANPTRRESRDYKRQLAAWQKAQIAYAKASAGPKKVVAKGTGAQAVAAAPQAVVTTDQTTTDNTKAGQRGGAAATAPNATATATTIKPPTPWLKYALWLAGAGAGYWLLFGGGWAVVAARLRRKKPTQTTA